MNVLLALAVIMTAPPPPPSDAKPTGPAPRMELLTPDVADGKIKLLATTTEEVPVKVTVSKTVNGAVVTEIVEQKRMVSKQQLMGLNELKGLKVTTPAGTEVNVATAVEKLARGGVVVISTDGQPVDPVYLRAFKDDTLVFVSDSLKAGVRVMPATATTLTGRVPLRLNAVNPIQVVPAQPIPVITPEKPAEKKEEKK